MQGRAGFTLLELSIVLTIIALIVGGIMYGQELYRQSELRSVVTEFIELDTAITNFKTKYSALPGDMRDAWDYWQTMGCGANANPVTTANPTGCNGDGNSELSEMEGVRAWQHMTLAQLIPGSYRGDFQDNPTTLIPGTHIPPSTIEGGGYMYYHRFVYDVRRKNLIGLGISGTTTNRSNLQTSVVSGPEAKDIDSKIDDGVANTGRMQAGFASCTGFAFNTTGGDYLMSATTPSNACILWYVGTAE